MTIILCLFIAFFVGVPICFALGIVSIGSLIASGMPLIVTVQRMFTGGDSIALIAIPLFMLSGELMFRGGMSKRLVDFADTLLGHFPSGLAMVSILACMFFAAITGSAIAATAAIGGIMIPLMKERGYEYTFSAPLLACGGSIGPIIPPSIPLLVYGVLASVSVADLYVGGVIPGILMGLCCMVVAFIGAKKAGMKATGFDRSQSVLKTVWDAVPSLLLIVIVIGGIVSGVFTATEGAGIAVLYCLILSIIYKSIDFKGFLGILLNSAKTSGIILFLISASSAMSFVMAYSGIPAAISNGLMSLTDNKYIIFLLMNIILLVIGMFMDITPAVLIFTPIFLPIAISFGMTEIQFGVMLIFNMCMGNITPPVGSVLFVGCGISKISIEEVTKTLLPYFAVLLLLLLAVTYIPALSLGIPSMMGLL